jgi:hypothetical protein
VKQRRACRRAPIVRLDAIDESFDLEEGGRDNASDGH